LMPRARPPNDCRRSDDAPAAATVRGIRGQSTLEFSRIRLDDCKEFRHLRAMLMPSGYRLTRTEAADGPRLYYVTRRGIAAEFTTLGDVRAFACDVGEGCE
jgi:hypothetical protein